jgi:hypothetical protein
MNTRQQEIDVLIIHAIMIINHVAIAIVLYIHVAKKNTGLKTIWVNGTAANVNINSAVDLNF